MSFKVNGFGIFLFITTLLIIEIQCEDISSQEFQAKSYFNDAMEEYERQLYVSTEAFWVYESNITEENLKIKLKAESDFAKFMKETGLKLLQFDYQQFEDEDFKRKVKKLTNLGDALLPDEKFKRLTEVVSEMSTNYATAKVPSFTDKTINFDLEPEITEVFAKSRDPEELKYYWTEWYKNSGKKNKDLFFEYVKLRNDAAHLNNYTSGAELWLKEYEDPTFEKQIEDILDQLMPLYQQLHGYVRYKLKERYGDLIDLKKPIPMHLLGNMWGQDWDQVSEIIAPYPDKPILDVTKEMIAQNYTARKMFEMGDHFFQSLNMTKLPEIFWEKSIIEKPNDGRELVCHASAWDFYTTDDVRIKQCTRINMDDFFTVHHELGHIQYFLQYQHLPAVYREGANPGFHEAVGDVLSLSVSTAKHLRKVGLLKNFDYDEETQLNQFVRVGLQKFAFLPFAFVLDKFRWEVFRGNIKPENANCKFWELREKYNGIEPPVFRSNDDFDPPSKYHISTDVEYLRYFVSYIIQFQFYKAVCEKAGEYVPGDPEKTLNECDIYENAEAGNIFKSMLQLGSSKPWPDAMEVITGQRKMDASAILEYFKPLSDFLTIQNEKLKVPIGWEKSDKYSCSASC